MEAPDAGILPARVGIVEVGPRDGLQNEDVVLATSAKVDLIQRLIAAGVRRIETVSFVHPELVPQMADAEAVMAELGPSGPDTSYIGLVLNRRGFERALATSVDAAMKAIEEMIPEAAAAGLHSTVTISVVWGCPFDGEVATEAVTTLAQRSVEAGVSEVALGDTIGVAVPAAVTERLAAVRVVTGDVPLRVHFHDTRNTGIANVYAALLAGVTAVDASVGGAGGCPFAPNATGNVPTEDVLYMLHRSGIETGIDLDAISEIGRWLGGRLDRELPSAIGKAGGFPGG